MICKFTYYKYLFTCIPCKKKKKAKYFIIDLDILLCLYYCRLLVW